LTTSLSLSSTKNTSGAARMHSPFASQRSRSTTILSDAIASLLSSTSGRAGYPRPIS
jgi:hypothetical protein